MKAISSKNDIEEANLNIWIGWLLIGFVFAAALVLMLAYGRFFPTANNFLHDKLNFRDAAAWGQLGDFMGGILNPLISACTLSVAVMVWHLQKTELREARKVATLQFQFSERAAYEATYVSCRDDIDRAIATVADSCPNSELTPLARVNALSRILEMKPPLITINSHAVSFSFHAPGFETPLTIEPWDWSISHGNDARETLRLMLPLCRSIGDTLAAVNSMPTEVKTEKFRRLRNSLDEWTLSTFTYFLVLHPDGAPYQTAAAAAHVLTNLRIQRALSFAKAYLPVPTHATPSREQ